MVLLKDGVKYFLHSYESEEELEKMVIEHSKEIFGEHSLYFDKETLKTRAGIEARNDGIIISLDENKWFILEAELSTHSPYEHIVPQITKFFNAYKSHETRKKITNTIYQTIKNDPIKFALIQTKKIEDLHKFLTDLIDFQPTIAIVIDSITDELDEVCKSLPFPTIITEFETFVREAVGLSVHAHLFEPLCKEKIPPKEKETGPPPGKIRKMPKALEQILAVTKMMYQGFSFAEAVKDIAKQRGVEETTIRDKCTRRLGLNTDQFIETAKDKPRLKLLLQERFPNYKNLIANEI